MAHVHHRKHRLAQPSSISFDLPTPEFHFTTPIIPLEAIARRAYAKWEARGCEHGHDLEDWLEAEIELLARVSLE